MKIKRQIDDRYMNIGYEKHRIAQLEIQIDRIDEYTLLYIINTDKNSTLNTKEEKEYFTKSITDKIANLIRIKI